MHGGPAPCLLVPYSVSLTQCPCPAGALWWVQRLWYLLVFSPHTLFFMSKVSLAVLDPWLLYHFFVKLIKSTQDRNSPFEAFLGVAFSTLTL